VLTGLIKHISKEVRVVSVEDMASVQQFTDMSKAL
jgi:hypothetical protein